MEPRLKSIGVWLIKFIVVNVAWGYVAYKFVTMKEDVSLIFTDELFSVSTIVVVLILMFCNWLVEARKWQLLVSYSQTISLRIAIKGVLIGLPLALITPNRVGEIGGRAFILENNRKDAVFATFIGSLTQLSATLLFGLIGGILVLCFFPLNATVRNACIISVLIVTILIILGALSKNRRFLKVITLHIVGRRYYRYLISVVDKFPPRAITQSLSYSLFRYCIFSTQFGLLVHMLVPDITVLEIAVGISLMYLFTTLIPTAVLGEIGIRGSVAMFIFQNFTDSVSQIFQVSLLLWVVNIAIPTVIGSFLLLRVRKRRVS